MTKKNHYFRILAYLLPHKKYLIGSIILTFLFATSNVMFMPLIRDIAREVSEKRLMYFNNQIFNALVLYLIRLSAKYGQFYLMNSVSNRVIIDMRIQLFEKLQKLSISFHEKSKLGDLISRLFSDVEKVKGAVLNNFEQVLPQSLTLVAVTVYLFFISWKLTLFSIIGIPLFIYLTMYFAKQLKRVAFRITRKNAELTHISQEALTNIKIIKAFTMEKHEVKRFSTESIRNFRTIMKEVRYRSFIEPFIAFLQFFVIIAVVWYGGYEIAKGNLNGPTLISFFTGILLLIDPVIELSKIYTLTLQSLASAERIFTILDSPLVIPNAPHAKHDFQVSGAVTFSKVSFQYHPDEKQVLNSINLTVSPGEIIALVGYSGAGKTTLINLIPRFYDVTKGKLLIDGVNVKDIDIYTLRKQIGIVPQESILFRGTILENIRYGDPKASEEEIIEAAKKANAWEFIESLPSQLRSRVGDRGLRLSGGQKQRVSIARAILKDPKILILDEATSSLDTKSEKLVQEALNVLMKNRTTFVIAHRLSTIMHANKIITLKAGKIVETGSHTELLEKNGHYATLYQIQFQKNTKKKPR